MGPRGGTTARLAAVCVLLSVAAVSCSADPSYPPPSPTTAGSPVSMIGTPAPGPTGAVPVVNGCASGTVPVTFSGDEGDMTACVTAGARLRISLVNDGYGTWDPLRVTPDGAATVASTTGSQGNGTALVTPTGTAPFCLSTDLMPAVSTSPVFMYRLCVTIRR